MSPFKILVTTALCAVSAGAFASDSTKIEGIEACMKIKWNAEFLKEHPSAPAGCQEVATRDGVRYAKFSGTVTAMSPTEATVAMKNVAGTERGKLTVNTGGDATVLITGKETKASDLKVGDSLNFYVREGDFGTSLNMAPAAPAKPVVPKAAN